eukprot:m.75960 g.75960  ORF g.75960 m.75960 type:complete len:2006 (+) comp8100_c2_seq1:1465-7482(+)
MTTPPPRSPHVSPCMCVCLKADRRRSLCTAAGCAHQAPQCWVSCGTHARLCRPACSPLPVLHQYCASLEPEICIRTRTSSKAAGGDRARLACLGSACSFVAPLFFGFLVSHDLKVVAPLTLPAASPTLNQDIFPLHYKALIAAATAACGRSNRAEGGDLRWRALRLSRSRGTSAAQAAPGAKMADSVPDKLRRIFKQLDTDNSGYIEAEEVDEMLQLMGITDERERREKVPRLVKMMDQDDDGEITLEEFSRAAIELGLVLPDTDVDDGMSPEDRAFYEEACAIFDSLDEDGSGTIDSEELEQILIQLGVTDRYEVKSKAKKLMKIMDEDGSGEVDREEFQEALRNGVLAEFVPVPGKTRQPVEFLDSGDVYADAGVTFDDDDDIPSMGGSPPRKNLKLLGNDADLTKSPALGRKGVRRGNMLSNATPEEKRRFLKGIFDLADESKDGQIGLEELYHILQDESIHRFTGGTKRNITKDYVRNVMSVLDTSGDGELDFDEFIVAFEKIFSSESEKPTFEGAQLNALRDENELLQADLDRIKSDYELLKSSSEATLRRHQHESYEALEAAEEENGVLQADNETLKREIKHLRIDNKTKQDRINALERDLLNQINEHEKALQNRRSLRDVFSTPEQTDSVVELRNLKRERAAAQDKIELLTRELQLLETAFETYKLEKITELNDLKAEADAAGSLRQANAELTRYVNELKAYLEEVEGDSKTSRSITFVRPPMDAQSSAPVAAASLSSADDRSLRLIEKQYGLKIKALEDEIAALTSRLDESKRAQEDLQIENSQHQETIERLELAIDSLEDRISQSRRNSKAPDMDAQILNLQEDLRLVNNEKNRLQAELDLLAKSSDQREKVNTQRMHENLLDGALVSEAQERLRNEIIECQKTIAIREKELIFVREQLDEVTRVKDAEIADLTELLDKTQRELEGCQKKLDEARENADAEVQRQLNDKQLELERLTAQLQEIDYKHSQALADARKQQEVRDAETIKEWEQKYLDAVAERDRSISQSDAEIARLRNELTHLQDRLEEALDAAAGDHAARADKLSKEIQQLREEKMAVDEEAAALRERLNANSGSQSTVQREIVSERTVVRNTAREKELEAQLLALRTQLSAEQDKWSVDRAALVKARDEFSHKLILANSDKERLQACLDASADEMQLTAQSLSDQLTDALLEKATLETQLENVRQEAEDTISRSQRLFDGQLAGLQQRCEDAEARARRAEAALHERPGVDVGAITTLKNERDEAIAALRNVEDELFNTKLALEELQSKVNSAESERTRALQDAQFERTRLRNELDSANERIKALREQMMDQMDIQSHEKELSEVRSQYREVLSDLSALEAVNEQLRSQCSALEDDLHAANVSSRTDAEQLVRLQENNQELMAARNRLEGNADRQSSEIEKLLGELRQQEQTLMKVREHAAQLENELLRGEHVRNFETLQTEHELAKREIGTMSQQHREEKQTLIELITHHEQTIHKHVETERRLEDDLMVRDDELERLRSQSSNNVAQIDALQAELDRTRSELNAARDNFAQLEAIVDQNMQHQEAQQELARAQMALEEQNRSLRTELDIKDSELEVARRQVRSFQEQLHSSFSEVDAMRDELRQAHDMLTAQADDIERLSNRLRDQNNFSKERMSQLEFETSLASESRTSLERTCKQQETLIRDLEETLAKLRADHRREVASLHEQLASSEKNCAKQAEIITQLTDEIARLKAELDRLLSGNSGVHARESSSYADQVLRERSMMSNVSTSEQYTRSGVHESRTAAPADFDPTSQLSESLNMLRRDFSHSLEEDRRLAARVESLSQSFAAGRPNGDANTSRSLQYADRSYESAHQTSYRQEGTPRSGAPHQRYVMRTLETSRVRSSSPAAVAKGRRRQVELEGWEGAAYLSPTGSSDAAFFPVNIWHSPVAERLGLSGPAWLRVSNDGMALLERDERHGLLRSWTWSVIRRFGKDRNLFSFEVGGQREPGVFHLATERMGDVFDHVTRCTTSFGSK